MRKTYGNTWWGAQWLNAFNHIDYSNNQLKELLTLD